MAAWFTYTGAFCFIETYIYYAIHICLSFRPLCILVFQAVQNGLWVVLEDVDKAPSDVHSILLPLLEGGNKFSTGHGEVLFPIDFNKNIE